MISIVKPLYCFIVSELRLEGMVNALEEIRFSIGEKILSFHLVEVLIAWRFSQKKKKVKFAGWVSGNNKDAIFYACSLQMWNITLSGY